jgi:hypothetical protein
MIASVGGKERRCQWKKAHPSLEVTRRYAKLRDKTKEEEGRSDFVTFAFQNAIFRDRAFETRD